MVRKHLLGSLSCSRVRGTASMAGVLMLICCALVVVVRGDIVTFDGSSRENNYYMVVSSTLYGRTSASQSRPFISFNVVCKQSAYISWIAIATDQTGLHIMESQNQLTAKCLTTVPASCINTNYSSTGNRRRSDDSTDTTTTTPTATTTTTTTATTTATSSTSSTTIAAATTPAPTMSTVTTYSDPSWHCSRKFGLGVESWVSPPYLGGCMACNADGVHFKIGDSPAEAAFFARSGYYTLWIESWASSSSSLVGPPITGEIVFVNIDGYLSATWYPLMIFYGVLGLLYLVLGSVWLALMACFRHDLLQLQIWVGLVIFIGMLHMAFSFGDLDYINNNGTRLGFLMVMAQLLLALKNTVARMLVLVVSMGFGVVKPRIDSSYKQLGGFSLVYFTFDLIYSLKHGLNETVVNTPFEVLAVIVLAVLDSALCYWILLSLSRTIAVLTVRRNKIKLDMYLRFRWILGACIIAAAGMIVWMVVDRKDDWASLWIQDAFWHVLFFVILVAIAFLWRPNNNNARFAYTPLEIDDDAEDSVTPNFAADTMKMRAVGRSRTPSEPDNDDIAATSFGGSLVQDLVMDSEEEILFARNETSKMQ